MVSKVKIAVFSILLTTATAVGGYMNSAPVFAAADANKSAACEAIGGGADCSTPTGGTDVNTVITVAVDIFSVIIGVVAVIMIIVAGFKYITSGGDSSKVSSAKTTLMYALIGLVIVALAQFIANFVLTNVG